METQRQSNARERILNAAYKLFSQRGIRAVGVDELIAASGVANATFYRHFASKDNLVLAFLDRREELWTLGTIVSQALARAESPKAQLLAIFDIFDEWFHKPDFEGDPFISILLEMGPDHPLGRAALERLDTVRDMVRGLAIEARLREPDSFAHSWHILMKGAIITARMGDLVAAQRAKAMGSSLIERFDPDVTLDGNPSTVREHAQSHQ
ncbi:MAG: helix-turn-helix domain-containing protein [Terrimesophilobacter sp.]